MFLAVLFGPLVCLVIGNSPTYWLPDRLACLLSCLEGWLLLSLGCARAIRCVAVYVAIGLSS